MKQTASKKLQQQAYRVRPIFDIKDLLAKSAQRFGSRPAFLLKNEQKRLYPVSYTELYTAYRALCTALLCQGLGPRDKIAIVGANSFLWAISYLAATTVGVAVPLDRELSGADIAVFLEKTQTKVLIGDRAALKKLAGLCVPAKTISMETGIPTLISKGQSLRKQGNAAFEAISIHPDEMRVLILTSGTSGYAKGVCLSHKNICENILSTAKMVRVKPTDRALSILPLHHTYECTLGFLMMLYSGACISYCDGLRHINKNMLESKPTFVVAVPILLESMQKRIFSTIIKGLPRRFARQAADQAPSAFLNQLPFYILAAIKNKVRRALGGKLHTFIVGGAPVDPETIRFFLKLGIRALQGYGLTECAPLLAGNNDFFVNESSAGLAIPGVELKICNPGPDGIGEILARGNNIMLGYYNDIAATEAVMRGGWFHTGDLGYLDKDGFLYITGRKKNVIIAKNGKNIYPEELEEVLLRHPFIKEVLILGVPQKDDIVIEARIYPDYEAIKRAQKISDCTQKEAADCLLKVVQSVNSTLPMHKKIRRVHVRETPFEKTTSQKMKRHGQNLT